MSPADKTASSAEIYDAFAAHYREYSDKKSAYIAGVDNLIVSHFAGMVENMLDFGAGDGVRGGALYTELGASQLVQADVSKEMLARCQALGKASEVWNVSNEEWLEKTQKFDLVCCLWNVLGHIPSTEARIEVLKNIKQCIKPNGSLCFDVNNRHYKGYGLLKSYYRRFIDFFWPDNGRGDAFFDWEIDGKTYAAHGHLFTKAEIVRLLSEAGFSVSKWYVVDYSKGTASKQVNGGQLFVIANPSA